MMTREYARICEKIGNCEEQLPYTDSRLTVVLADSLRTVGQHSADSFIYVLLKRYLLVGHKLADSRPTVA